MMSNEERDPAPESSMSKEEVTAHSRTLPPVAKLNLPTMFGQVLENFVTFCVDTSGSMYNCLHVVKEQLIETLHKHALKDHETLFNIIEFNSDVTQWADKMVKCTPETVAVASDWIKRLNAKTGTNTQDALLTAFSDPSCRAVYLVTDGKPDQNAEDILDHVAYISDNRPVHCIYLTGNKVDELATEFLEDLAVETYGSFHIVSLTVHGCVERITPIYRADHSSQRLIKTVENHVRPNIKTCSVSTTLAVDPEETLQHHRSAALNHFTMYQYFWPYLGGFPNRYYWPHYWSRYHPAKAWLKVQESIGTPIELSPSAGALLIGKKVMARRIDDGYFYIGTVQSQILDNKFLVSFGPCKHGKYQETSYQDTFVFDIIDVVDARRHALLTGDEVLAPWEAEGERFGPGIIIDGHEKRSVQGPEDKQITVKFNNGHTVEVPVDTAIWLPKSVFERLCLELKMPQDAREILQRQGKPPHDFLPGYPLSSPDMPLQESDMIFLDAGNFSIHKYITPTQHQYPKTAVKSEDLNALIPGTNITQGELQVKVSSLLNDIETQGKSFEEKVPPKITLLKKRGKKAENTLRKTDSLKKSVSFNDENLVREAFVKRDKVERVDFDIEDADSGYEVSPDPSHESIRLELEKTEMERERLQFERDFLDGELEKQINKEEFFQGITPRKSRPLGRRPPWKYFNNEGMQCRTQSAHGPFRETALQAPLEARDQRNASINSVEWRSPCFKFVDRFAKGDYSNSVELLMKPHPPPGESSTTPPDGTGVADAMGYTTITEKDKDAARREFRRQQIIKRREEWKKRMTVEDNMNLAMREKHHNLILDKLKQDRDRQIQDQQLITQQQEAKKKISTELQKQIDARQQKEVDRESQRIETMRQRREHRESVEQQRKEDIENIQTRRQQIKVQQNQARADAYAAQLDEEESRNIAQRQKQQNAKLNRINLFHKAEVDAQRKKDLRIGVNNMTQSMLQSQIFP